MKKKIVIDEIFDIDRRGNKYTLLAVKVTEDTLSVGDIVDISLKDGGSLSKEILHIDAGFVRGGIQPKTAYKGDNICVHVGEICKEEIMLRLKCE
ncbi:hypothetical protein [Clostridium sp. KNHs205]|uniref:hypothetical protein n=1 Tax=Clostridium sp. KNHs205 TaxID=1449050 RepID=UPI00051B1AFE|nr:hypothetical protein [Clostridium sp. KNHs205]